MVELKGLGNWGLRPRVVGLGVGEGLAADEELLGPRRALGGPHRHGGLGLARDVG